MASSGAVAGWRPPLQAWPAARRLPARGRTSRGGATRDDSWAAILPVLGGRAVMAGLGRIGEGHAVCPLPQPLSRERERGAGCRKRVRDRCGARLPVVFSLSRLQESGACRRGLERRRVELARGVLLSRLRERAGERAHGPRSTRHRFNSAASRSDCVISPSSRRCSSTTGIRCQPPSDIAPASSTMGWSGRAVGSSVSIASRTRPSGRR